MGVTVRRVSLIAIALVCGACTATDAARSPVVERPLSYQALKFSTTVRQRFDFSCGAATVATVLTHYWGRPVDELAVMEVLRRRYPGEDWKTIQERGFSFEDLIFAAAHFGFEAQGATVPVDELRSVDAPVIVHLDKGSFQHFSVLRLARGGRYYLSDPIVGAVSLTTEEFSRQYTGSALAIWRKGSALPRNALLARPYPAIDPEGIVGGVMQGRLFDTVPRL